MKKINANFGITIFAALLGAICMACTNSEPTEATNNRAPVEEAAFHNNKTGEDSMITLNTGLDHSKFMFTDAGYMGYYYVEAKAGKHEPVGKTRTPLNLSIVIDHSGSMEGDKLVYAKKAARFVVDQLNSEDYVSVVIYDDEVEVIAASARAADKASLQRRIDGIRSDGSTNLGGGMEEGYKQVKSTYKSGYINRVLLLSDGLANVGITDINELQRIAKNKNLEDGITISTFGIGLDFNEDLMTGISEYGSGNYYFIQNPDAIPAIFEKELNGLLNVVAQNAVLTVELPTGMVLDKLFGYKYEQSGNRVIVNFRDIFSQETKAVLIRFRLTGRDGQYALKSTLTYNEATTEAKEGRKLEAIDMLTLAETQAAYANSESRTVQTQVVLFESNEKLEAAMREADKGNYEAARVYVKENETFLESKADYIKASPELQRQQATNTTYSQDILRAEEMNESERKTMQKASKAANYDVRKKR